MDEFGRFTESLGLKPQGKSAPMAASKRPTNTTGLRNFGDSTRSAQKSNSGNGSFLDDYNGLFPSSTNPKSRNSSNSYGYGDVFGDPIKKSTQSDASSFDYGSIFDNLNDSGSKNSSMPAYSKPVHVDDIFGGMPETKTSTSVKHDDVFASFTSAPKKSVPIDDLLAKIGGSKSGSMKESGAMRKNSNSFDHLMPGFGGSSSFNNGSNMEKSWPRQSTTIHSTKSMTTLLEDPFAGFESTSTPVNTSSSLFSDPLEEISKLNTSGSTKESSSSGEAHDNMDPFDIFTKSVPSRSEEKLKTADDAWTKIPKIPPYTKSTNGSPQPRPPPAKTSKADRAKGTGASSIEELEDFAKGRVRNNIGVPATTLKEATDRFEAKFKQARESKERRAKASRAEEPVKVSPQKVKVSPHKSEDDIESFFSASSRSRSAPRSRARTTDSVSDTQSQKGGPKVAQRSSSGTPSSVKKVSTVPNMFDDLSSFFGAGLSVGEFQEVEGESEERRNARMGRHSRTQDRVAQAVADMNQRDLQIQREQEERQRIAQNLDSEIKRWAVGKEGNLRALLSTLQYVLWSGSGWQPVSLTDMITSASVKKVYRKANLCIHPDKVQQKGANLEQKYVAEKVFDVLKEAWNKFNSEELS